MEKKYLNNLFKTSLSIFAFYFINIIYSFAKSSESDNALQGSLNFKEAATNITSNILTSASTLLMTAAFALFFWGIVRFLYDRSNGDDTRLEKDKEAMVWGLGALFVMVSVWGIIRLFQDFIGIKGDSNIQIQSVAFIPPPKLKTDASSDPDTSESSSLAKKEFKYDSCSSDKDCGDTGMVCQGSKGRVETKGRERGICMSAEEAKTDNLEQTADGNLSDNPFANQENFPTISLGAKSDLKAGASADKKAFTLLYGLLKRKKCTTAPSNPFGSTYDETDMLIVKLFQKTNGLTENGVVDKITWEALSVNTGQKTTFSGNSIKDCK